jgi:hypothetical protein
MCGWIALLGVGSFAISADRRWTAWCIPMQSIFIWHALVLVASFMKASDFTRSIVNWYTLAIAAMVIGMAAIYFVMEKQRRTAR